MAKRNEHLEAALKVCAEEGVEVQLKQGGKHTKVCFRVAPTEGWHSYPVAGTPGDHRGVKNCTSQMRHAIRRAREMAAHRGR